MTPGFSVSEVRAKGPGMADAFVRFGRGLSLLTGPSDTGKSFVAEAINHVFGASSELRDLVPEKGRYDRLLVEISVYETAKIYTLARAWAGGDIALYESPASTVDDRMDGSRTLRSVHDSTPDSVSGFLLGLCGLNEKQLRTNATGTKVQLSFRDLPMYTLIQEGRIMEVSSPILTGQYTTPTKELSLFKLLLTGTDDSAVVTAVDRKTRKGLDSGRREVLDSLIQEVRTRIEIVGRTENDLRSELSEVERSLANQTVVIQGAGAEVAEQEERRKSLWGARTQTAARAEQVRELLERFALLDKLYDADIARLESTQESGRLLVQFSEGPCPLCGAEPADHRHDGWLRSDDVERLTVACEAERRKLVLLKSELEVTLAKLRDEDEALAAAAQRIETNLSSIQATLFGVLEPGIRATKQGLEELFERRRLAEKALGNYDELRRLESARDKFKVKSSAERKSVAYDKTPVSATDALAETIGDILGKWNYPGVGRVVFDPGANDIVINGKPRGSHGKGYRAITYAAFMVGVMLYCRERNLPHPGFVILDSPLVTYRKPEKAESADDLIDEGMVPHFYHHLSTLAEDCQVIVIENDDPQREVIERASFYSHFTRNRLAGRYGFLLSAPPE
ncbi:MAG: hypothetical protein ACO1SV_07310 [Fimbriimonas sp.]